MLLAIVARVHGTLFEIVQGIFIGVVLASHNSTVQTACLLAQGCNCLLHKVMPNTLELYGRYMERFIREHNL